MERIPAYEEQQGGLVLIEKRDGVCYLTMNRPRCMNAFNIELRTELLNAFEKIAHDRKSKVVVLEGAGKHFSAGGDLNVINEKRSPSDWLWGMRGLAKLIITMQEMPQPIICKVRGVAFGMAANLALAGDFVVASENMRFCEVFSNIGVIMDGGGHYFLPRLVGLSKAMELALLGEEIDGPTAEGMGLVYKCVPDSELDHEVDQLALKLVKKSSQAMALTKEGLVRSLDMTLKEVLEWEAAHQTIMLQSEEHKAMLSTLLESRKTKK